MSRLPLSVLPAFATAAKLENLRATADALHLTHSAVSQQIRVLEEQLGFALFDRQGRRIVLNAAGAALLRSVGPALAMLDDGMQAAAAAAAGEDHRLRVSVLPSFAQRWLMPRIGRWRERHPDIAIEIESSPQVVDLARAGFHAGVRSGRGSWPGLEVERMLDSPLVVVGSPPSARRVLGRGPAALVDEPLLDDAPLWEQWFAAAGVRTRVRTVAVFNDAGLMLQAAEHDIGLALAREMLVADALAEGRLVRISDVAIEPPEGARSYFFVYPPAQKAWLPLVAFRAWLFDELAAAQAAIDALHGVKETAPASRSGSRSPAPSAPRARAARRAR